MESRIVESTFVPARWLRNRHLQTVFPSLPWTQGPRPQLRNETLELPDGDITSVDWLPGGDNADDTPLLVILHGLEGSAESPYCRQLLWAASMRGPDWGSSGSIARQAG